MNQKINACLEEDIVPDFIMRFCWKSMYLSFQGLCVFVRSFVYQVRQVGIIPANPAATDKGAVEKGLFNSATDNTSYLRPYGLLLTSPAAQSSTSWPSIPTSDLFFHAVMDFLFSQPFLMRSGYDRSVTMRLTNNHSTDRFTNNMLQEMYL